MRILVVSACWILGTTVNMVAGQFIIFKNEATGSYASSRPADIYEDQSFEGIPFFFFLLWFVHKPGNLEHTAQPAGGSADWTMSFPAGSIGLNLFCAHWLGPASWYLAGLSTFQQFLLLTYT